MRIYFFCPFVISGVSASATFTRRAYDVPGANPVPKGSVTGSAIVKPHYTLPLPRVTPAKQDPTYNMSDDLLCRPATSDGQLRLYPRSQLERKTSRPLKDALPPGTATSSTEILCSCSHTVGQGTLSHTQCPHVYQFTHRMGF